MAFWHRRRVEDRALTRDTLPGVLFGEPTAGEPVSPRGAMAVADVYAAVRALVDAAASLPLHVYRRTRVGRERVEQDATVELPWSRLDRPAPALTAAHLVADILRSLLLAGDAFIGKYRDGFGAMAQLGVLDPSRVQVDVRGGMPFYTVTSTTGEPQTVGVESVIHVRSLLSLDGIRGLSPIAACREAVSAARAMGTHAAATFANGASPAGIVTSSDPNAREQLKAVAEGWEARHRGPGNAGRLAFVTGELSYTQLSLSAQDVQFVQQRELSTREVARIFRLPPWIIGADAGSSLTYSNTTDQIRFFAMVSLAPWLALIERRLSADDDLFPRAQRAYCAFDLDGLLRGDAQARAAVYTAALDPLTGWMNRGEVRAMEDLPAEPDRPTVPDFEEIAA